MPLFLVEPDLSLTLELPIPEATIAALTTQLEQMEAAGEMKAYCSRLAAEIARLLPELVNWECKAPTSAQLAFALSLCRKLGIELPSGATDSRGAMYRFLAVHAPRDPGLK